jgi:TRAP-type C4-dicarboxylate transport system permease small subunit
LKCESKADIGLEDIFKPVEESYLRSDKPIRVDYWIAAILLMSMALIAFVNVLSRYFINFSIGATEEITINLFVWMTVVGTGIAFERGAQLGMVTFFNRFP